MRATAAPERERTWKPSKSCSPSAWSSNALAIAARLSSFLSFRFRRRSSFSRLSSSSLASASACLAALSSSIVDASSGAASESSVDVEIFLARSPAPLRALKAPASSSPSDSPVRLINLIPAPNKSAKL